MTLGAWVRVGGRDEPDELSGASHFLEHLLFKGTERRSAKQIAEAIDSVGGEMNAFTAREHTAYYARLPHEQMALGRRGARRRAHRAGAPRRRGRGRAAGDRRGDPHEPRRARGPRAHRARREALFPDHPLGREVLGEMPTVEAITRDDIAAFFGRWYRPAAIVVTAAGRLEHAAVVDAVQAGFDGQRGRRAARAACRRRRAGGRTWSSSTTTPSRPTSASGGAASPTRTTTAGPCRSPTRCSAAAWPAGSSRRCARSGASPTPCTRTPPPSRTPATSPIYCGTAPKRARETLAVIDDVLAAGARRRHHRRTSWPSPPATSRARCCSGSRTAAAAWPASAAASCSATDVTPDRRARRTPPRRHHRRRVPRPAPRPRLTPHPRRGRPLQRRRAGGLQPAYARRRRSLHECRTSAAVGGTPSTVRTDAAGRARR